MDIRPMWLLSGQTAGSLVRWPVLPKVQLGFADALERLARYFRVAVTAGYMSGGKKI